MRELILDGVRIADDTDCYVIAELGGNHGGDLPTAYDLITTAVQAGASAVKFQTRDNVRLYTSALLSKPYENEHSYGTTYGEHRAHLELAPSQLQRCALKAADEGITCFSTAFDEASVDVLMDLHMPAIKIHSGGLTDAPLIRHAARQGVPVVLSTGGGTMDDVDRAVEWLAGCPHALLHCTASYPLTPAHANLRVITMLRQRFPDTVIGFSSHAPGLTLSYVAYALGARIIEHHVTLNRAGKGTDHAFSLEPKGLQTLVADLHSARVSLGDGIKRLLEDERAPIAKMRRTATPEGWRIAG